MILSRLRTRSSPRSRRPSRSGSPKRRRHGARASTGSAWARAHLVLRDGRSLRAIGVRRPRGRSRRVASAGLVVGSMRPSTSPLSCPVLSCPVAVDRAADMKTATVEVAVERRPDASASQRGACGRGATRSIFRVSGRTSEAGARGRTYLDEVDISRLAWRRMYEKRNEKRIVLKIVTPIRIEIEKMVITAPQRGVVGLHAIPLRLDNLADGEAQVKEDRVGKVCTNVDRRRAEAP